MPKFFFFLTFRRASGPLSCERLRSEADGGSITASWRAKGRETAGVGCPFEDRGREGGMLGGESTDEDLGQTKGKILF